MNLIKNIYLLKAINYILKKECNWLYAPYTYICDVQVPICEHEVKPWIVNGKYLGDLSEIGHFRSAQQNCFVLTDLVYNALLNSETQL